MHVEREYLKKFVFVGRLGMDLHVEVNTVRTDWYRKAILQLITHEGTRVRRS